MSLRENKQMSKAGRKKLKYIDPNIETCELPLKMWPRWFAFLMLYWLMYNLRSLFTELILA